MTADGWQGFRFHRLTQVPRPAGDGHSGRDEDEVRRALHAALTGSHADLLATGDPSACVVAAWARPPDDPAVQLLVGGRPFFPPAAVGGRNGTGPAAGERSVLFPPGAAAVAMDGTAASRMLGGLPHWVTCSARSDALWADGQRSPGPPRRGSFDSQATHLATPFAWVVTAQPLRPEQVQGEIDTLVGEILPLSRGEVSEARRVALERKQSRHRELVRSQDGGAWMVRVTVGACTPSEAGTVAALLCAASELDGLPYVLAPVRNGSGTDGAFAASTELVVALTRPPRRELPGLRMVEPPGFDVTPEAKPVEAGGAGGLHLGAVLDEAGADVGSLTLGTGTLNRHTFVAGATGSGKSLTVRHLLEQATRAGIPWLAIEPAKSEYSRMVTRLAPLGAEVVVLRPGVADQPPAGINPLEPAPGFPLQTHVDLLRALFLAAFEPVEPFPQVLAAALKRCYEDLGWDLTLGIPAHAAGGSPTLPRYPQLGDLEATAETIVGEIGYGREIADNVRGFVRVRLSSLRTGTTGRFFEGGHPLDFGRLHAGNAVLEIEDVGDDADKAFLVGVVLIRLVEHLRVAARDGTAGPAGGAAGGGLRHLTVVEEAHRLLRRPGQASGPAAHAVEQFASLLAEVRAYGEGLIVAEQIPGKLVPDVIKNTAVKVVHRLPAQDDRDSVGATMNLAADQSRHLVTLTPGVGAVFTDGMDRPVLVRVPDGTAAEAGVGPGAVAAAPAPVAGVVGRRSPTCGRDCQAAPCTLRQIRTAQQLVVDQPWVGAWAELAVLAHLVGRPVPVPDRALRGVDSRTVDCALSHAVDEAVSVRSGTLPPWFGPTELSEHVCSALRRVLAGQDHGCGGDGLRYLAVPFQWELARQALVLTPDAPGRHPDSAAWESRFRRPLPGETHAEQLEVVEAWFRDDWDDVARRESVIYGARRPSALEPLVGAPDAGRERRVATLLTWFPGCAWPLAHLVPDPPPSSSSSSSEGA